MTRRLRLRNGLLPASAGSVALRAIVAAVVGALFVAGCLGGRVSQVPATSPTSSTNPTPGESGGPLSSPTAEVSPRPFDPATVAVSLEPYASVPGSPLAIAAPTDGTGRLLVATKEGQVLVIRDGAVQPEPMLDLSALVSTGGEQGLLGIAVHPDFPDDQRLVVHYTDTGGDTVVASYRLEPTDPDRLDPGSAATLLAVDQPFANHNGGAVAFGPDGYLYIGLGDGGAGGDPLESGEHLDTLLGKVLRVDIDAPVPGGAAYAIPPDNPFGNVDGARPEIWLTGLRNPWRFAFDRATGDLWMGDVGQGAWEEVDVAPAGVGGLDFGWDRMEGAHCFEPAVDCPTDGLTLPVTEYSHADGCTVIGGVVYRGSMQPMLSGAYLFADYCSGRIWAIPAASVAGGTGPIDPVRVGTAGRGLAAFGEDEAGELYAANLDGTISRVVATAR